MKSHELLDMIGDVNEDYVLEAGNNVVKPRFRWKALAACAACAALVLGAYPVYRAAHPPLHSYTVLEGSGMAEPQALVKGGGIDTPGQNTPDPAQTGEGQPFDASAQWTAIAQYQGLLRGMGGQGGREPEPYPDWYGGAWIDDSGDKLAVAIVDGFHTGELEARIEEWCHGEVVFVQDMKYSYAHLLNLMDQILQALPEPVTQDDMWFTFTSMRPDMMANCLVVGFSDTPADAVLAFLAQLDPAGDAIQVETYPDKPNALTDEGPARAPVDPEARATPAVEPAPVENSNPVPGGASPAEDPPETKEASQPARYDLLPLDE